MVTLPFLNAPTGESSASIPVTKHACVEACCERLCGQRKSKQTILLFGNSRAVCTATCNKVMRAEAVKLWSLLLFPRTTRRLCTAQRTVLFTSQTDPRRARRRAALAALPAIAQTLQENVMVT